MRGWEGSQVSGGLVLQGLGSGYRRCIWLQWDPVCHQALVWSLLGLHRPLHRRSLGQGSWGPRGGLGDRGLRPCAAWLGLGQGRVLLFVHPRPLFYLSGPGWFVSGVNAPTIMIQGLPVPGQDLLLLLLLKLLLLLLLLQGLEVGMLLLQLPLETL